MSTDRLPKLPPGADVVFRRLFDEDDRCRLLISLLNGILKMPPDDRITELTLLPTHVMGPQADDKEIVLDVRAQTQKARQFQIEVQVRAYDAYAERALYCWAGMYHGQLDAGQSYRALQPVIGVHFLYFFLLPIEDRFRGYHHVFELRERQTGYRLTGHLELHTLEMVKFKYELAALADDEQRWLFFLKHGHEMNAEQVQELGVPEIAEANRKLTMISQDRILRMQYEQRQMAERDAFAYAEDKWKGGLEQGHREGRASGKAEAVLHVLTARGVEVSLDARTRILSCTDLTMLDRWLTRAMTVTAAAQMFGETYSG